MAIRDRLLDIFFDSGAFSLQIKRIICILIFTIDLGSKCSCVRGRRVFLSHYGYLRQDSLLRSFEVFDLNCLCLISHFEHECIPFVSLFLIILPALHPKTSSFCSVFCADLTTSNNLLWLLTTRSLQIATHDLASSIVTSLTHRN